MKQVFIFMGFSSFYTKIHREFAGDNSCFCLAFCDWMYLTFNVLFKKNFSQSNSKNKLWSLRTFGPLMLPLSKSFPLNIPIAVCLYIYICAHLLLICSAVYCIYFLSLFNLKCKFHEARFLFILFTNVSPKSKQFEYKQCG